MLTGAIVSEQPKSISAVKKRASGPARMKRRGGHNIIWKRITAAYDEHLRAMGANPAMAAPVTRWVLYGHLTPAQGMAARRYADIVHKFERYHMEASKRTPGSADLEPMRKGEEDVVQRHIVAGSLPIYMADARKAKRQYRRLMKVLDRFADRVTGRNYAKDYLDELCLFERELSPDVRKDVAAVLSAVAKEFGVAEKRRKVQ